MRKTISVSLPPWTLVGTPEVEVIKFSMLSYSKLRSLRILRTKCYIYRYVLPEVALNHWNPSSKCADSEHLFYEDNKKCYEVFQNYTWKNMVFSLIRRIINFHKSSIQNLTRNIRLLNIGSIINVLIIYKWNNIQGVLFKENFHQIHLN